MIPIRCLLMPHTIYFEIGMDIYYLNRENEDKHTAAFVCGYTLVALKDFYDVNEVLYSGFVPLPNRIITKMSRETKIGKETLDSLENWLLEQLVVNEYEKMNNKMKE